MSGFWTNLSVLRLGVQDPEAEILRRATAVVLEAIEQGWSGPPFDPFELARLRGIDIVPREDLYDAAIRPVGNRGALRIEFNPARPRARQRYSVAHEIAHTLFPDVAEAARYRAKETTARGSDDWQVELLCNLAAGELLMPAGTFPDVDGEEPNIEIVGKLREQFEVSTEAVLLRLSKLADRQIGVFAASRTDGSRVDSALRLEYVRASRSWSLRIAPGRRLPHDSALATITAIGFTACGRETWPGKLDQVHVEGVGIPPYPGQQAPRIVGLVHPHRRREPHDYMTIDFVRGDATVPRGHGARVIVHVVNDRTPNWGGQFAQSLRERYPSAQAEFRAWATRPHLRLGETHLVEVQPEIWVASMIAQAGYGPSARPRIRYVELQRCLRAVGEAARRLMAHVHMPRIGAGQAGGRWPVVQELIEDELIRKGVPVTVYSLPGENWTAENHQTSLPVG